MLVSAAEKFRAERDHFWIGQDEIKRWLHREGEKWSWAVENEEDFFSLNMSNLNKWSVFIVQKWENG